ncbi:flavodoxin-dependent (E)-4-hydroxy-3-methylbut-2-enyl-diphosphate synthase [bacterium]|nr:flavodoxin-dependent (E)-4-hydroxy-3-methylbut-2-enyl-diphosphate synthase [bacterium]
MTAVDGTGGSFRTRRRATRRVKIGPVPVGGDAPVSIQSMTNTKTENVAATLAQIERLASRGCEIVRVAVPGAAAVAALTDIVAGSSLPVVADVHFDHRLAISAVEAGAHALRINPGNIGGTERTADVVAAAAEHGVPIRVGVNAGSLEKDILERDGHPTAAGLAESAERGIELMDRLAFEDVIVSIKASDVAMTVEANRLFAVRTDVPLHVGITEAGTPIAGAARSGVGLGLLLAEGIGDTVRVSLAGPPEDEIPVARAILSALGLRNGGVTVVACPTCGRTEIDVAGIAARVEEAVAGVRTQLVVAVMGCAVNGPGEAREADVGIAGGGTEAILFRKGEVVARLKTDEMIERLLDEVRKLT